jgi:cyclin-dependent kinase 10
VYDEAVDIWSVGCVFGELLRHAPLFPAKTELECIRMHCDLLGTPTPRIWKVGFTT